MTARPQPTWGFLTNHARALLYIAAQPDARLRDMADALGVTERTAFGIVADLTSAGYVTKQRDGRRNRYSVQEDLPLQDRIGRERTIGDLLDLLADRRDAASARRGRGAGADRRGGKGPRGGEAQVI